MSTANLIYDTAIELLQKKAVHASDGFRQWLYTRPYGPRADYEISSEASTFVQKQLSRGKSAKEITDLGLTERN